MTLQPQSIDLVQDFVAYVAKLKGDEKGEAQVFLDRLFRALGHEGYKEAGAELETRIRSAGRGTKFADLVWRDRGVLVEMKRRGENLSRHRQQAFEYWVELVPKRPRYVLLCNFDELWIYDFDTQVDEPMDRVPIPDLGSRLEAISFLLPRPSKPLFQNNRVKVTEEAAQHIAGLFTSLSARLKDRECAQRFVLQCVVALFADDIGLLPRSLFTRIIHDCLSGESSYDLLGNLFRQMNSSNPARGGRYVDVPYFNGGLFSTVDPIDLEADELNVLRNASSQDWTKVDPAIFGTIFQSSLTPEARHAHGAHYTSEADIQRVVLPTIVRPWRTRIEQADTLKQLMTIRKELASCRVLDPACGSGNFLYVAYREMKRLELQIIEKIQDKFTTKKAGLFGAIKPTQFYGFDILPFAVELAKVTLLLAKELAIKEINDVVTKRYLQLPFDLDPALPLDNLDQNILLADALHAKWPPANIIIGNPPFQSKNKMQEEFGPEVLTRLQEAFPEVPGHADYCVYFFRKTHDHLPKGGRAGLVGTNTIRQNYSRIGGLDWIVNHGGTIVDAVASQPWTGDAIVHVSIVNWTKDDAPGPFKLARKLDDGSWELHEVDRIPSSLTHKVDVTTASALVANAKSDACLQGQTHGHEGFLLSREEAAPLLARHPNYAEVLHPYLIGDDLLTTSSGSPRRYVIDFHPRDIFACAAFPHLFEKVKREVLPDRQKAAEEETRRNDELRASKPNARVNHHHANFLSRWWLLSYPRAALISILQALPRYIACSRVTKRPVFAFVSSEIRPSDALQVFPLCDDYSFGILQSSLHWEWFSERCSSLKGDPRYTSNTVFDSFPWPQSPTPKDVRAVARAAVDLRQTRTRILADQGIGLRELYRLAEQPGKNELRTATAKLDAAVASAYGMTNGQDALQFLLHLNKHLALKEVEGSTIVGPGLPPLFDPRDFTTPDCIVP